MPTFCHTNVDFWSICTSQVHMRYVVNIRPFRSILQLSIGSKFLTMYVMHTVYICIPLHVGRENNKINIYKSRYLLFFILTNPYINLCGNFSPEKNNFGDFFSTWPDFWCLNTRWPNRRLQHVYFAAMKQGAWNITKVNTSSFIPHGAQLLGPLEHETVEA